MKIECKSFSWYSCKQQRKEWNSKYLKFLYFWYKNKIIFNMFKWFNVTFLKHKKDINKWDIVLKNGSGKEWNTPFKKLKINWIFERLSFTSFTLSILKCYVQNRGSSRKFDCYNSGPEGPCPLTSISKSNKV